MRNLLDKIDQGSLFVKIILIVLGISILGTGLVFTNQRQRENEARAPRPSVRVSSSSSSSTSSSEDTVEKEAEGALKAFEENPSQDQAASVREAIAKVTNEQKRTAFEERLETALASIAPAQPQQNAVVTPVQPQQNTVTPAPVQPQAPAYTNNTATYTENQVYTDANAE